MAYGAPSSLDATAANRQWEMAVRAQQQVGYSGSPLSIMHMQPFQAMTDT